MPRIQFDGQRIDSYRHVLDGFSDLALHEFTLIPDDPCLGGLIRNAPEQLVDAQQYACRCFWFRRR